MRDRTHKFFTDRPSMFDHNVHGAGVEISLSLEAAEVLELRKMRDIYTPQEYADRLASELADVWVYAETLAAIHNIDLLQAVDEKVAANELRFPPDMFQGNRDDFLRQYWAIKTQNGERR